MKDNYEEGFSLLEDHEISEAKGYRPVTLNTNRSKGKKSFCRKRILISFGILLLLVGICIMLLTLVLKLKDTKISLENLHLPDLCSKVSKGAASVQFHNPSYCEPTIGPMYINVEANGIRLLDIEIPAFPVVSGHSNLTSDIVFSIIANASTLQQIIFEPPTPDVTLNGKVPVHLRCLLIPFTVNLDIHDLIHFPSKSTFRNDDIDFAERVRQMIHDILESLGLSQGHLEQDDDGVYLFTDVTFNYLSQVQWKLPDLNFHLANPSTNHTLLTAALYGFTLGAGSTHLNSFAYLKHNDSNPLLDAVTAYLRGEDVPLKVLGGDPLTQCFAQHLWNDMHYLFNIPGTEDGKPAFLRQYNLDPTLKKLDSTTHQCELRLDVSLTIHNPLPFELELKHLQFDVLYRNVTSSILHRVGTALDPTAVDWKSHMVNDVNFTFVVKDFDVCEDLLVLYLGDALSFSIQAGNLTLALGQGSPFDIPFEVNDIRVHPPEDQLVVDL